MFASNPSVFGLDPSISYVLARLCSPLERLILVDTCHLHPALSLFSLSQLVVEFCLFDICERHPVPLVNLSHVAPLQVHIIVFVFFF